MNFFRLRTKPITSVRPHPALFLSFFFRPTKQSLVRFLPSHTVPLVYTGNMGSSKKTPPPPPSQSAVSPLHIDAFFVFLFQRRKVGSEDSKPGSLRLQLLGPLSRTADNPKILRWVIITAQRRGNERRNKWKHSGGREGELFFKKEVKMGGNSKC